MRPQINSVKHYHQRSKGDIAELTIEPTNFVVATENPSGPTAVRIGSTIKAVYVEFWINADSSQLGSFQLTVEKLSSGQGNMSFIDAGQLHDYPNKKNIFYTTQGLAGDNNANPMPIVRQWIKIPKGKQRMGLGDIIAVNIAALESNITRCGLMIFKEYF